MSNESNESEDPRELAYRMCLEMRGVDEPCPACSGFGVRVYGSTATWRGGIGGQALTSDVCDKCWGTGDARRKGADLRVLTGQRRAWEAEQCAQWLARRAGVELTSMREHLRLLIGVLEREARKRKPAGVEEREVFWYRQSIDALAGALSELLAEAETTHHERTRP